MPASVLIASKVLLGHALDVEHVLEFGDRNHAVEQERTVLAPRHPGVARLFGLEFARNGLEHVPGRHDALTSPYSSTTSATGVSVFLKFSRSSMPVSDSGT